MKLIKYYTEILMTCLLNRKRSHSKLFTLLNYSYLNLIIKNNIVTATILFFISRYKKKKNKIHRSPSIPLWRIREHRSRQHSRNGRARPVVAYVAYKRPSHHIFLTHLRPSHHSLIGTCASSHVMDPWECSPMYSIGESTLSICVQYFYIHICPVGLTDSNMATALRMRKVDARYTSVCVYMPTYECSTYTRYTYDWLY